MSVTEIFSSLAYNLHECNMCKLYQLGVATAGEQVHRLAESAHARDIEGDTCWLSRHSKPHIIGGGMEQVI